MALSYSCEERRSAANSFAADRKRISSLLWFCLILVFVVLFRLPTGDVEYLHRAPPFLTVMRNERATWRSLIHS